MTRPWVIAWSLFLGGCGPATSDGDAPRTAADATPAGVDAPSSQADAHQESRAPDAGADQRSVDAGVERGTDAPASDAPIGGSGPCTPGTGFDTSVTGVALDRASCLAWERGDLPKDKGACLIARDSEAKLCFDEAVAYCRSLRLDSKSDWRLPTVAELRTIVVPQSYPALDKAVFSQALISLYWTSERNGEKVVCLDFSNAGMLNDHIGPDGPQGVRCVRSAR